MYILCFSANVICDFQMNNYPFDFQVCYINMTLGGKQLLTARYLLLKSAFLYGILLSIIIFIFQPSPQDYIVQKLSICFTVYHHRLSVVFSRTARRWLQYIYSNFILFSLTFLSMNNNNHQHSFLLLKNSILVCTASYKLYN